MASFLIYSPKINPEKSGGVRALHNLARLLRERGQRVRFSYDFIEARAGEIVIYPEIVQGNPMGGARVVRWCLRPNREPWPGDLVMRWAENFDIPADGLLYVPIIDREIFRDYGGPRVFTLTYKADRVEGDIEITDTWPEYRSELIGLLAYARVLRCGDPLTALSAEARLCGCEVEMVNGDMGMIPIDAPDYAEQLAAYEARGLATVDALIERCDAWQS